jgi:retron-type reverse transcriptase
VKANKGSAGVDGRTVLETGEHLKGAWPDIRSRLLDGTYRPEPVRRVGIPKPGGGTLSPMLINVLLDEVDRELERRGHRFVRYADDCNVYVTSRKAGERVLHKRCAATTRSWR